MSTYLTHPFGLDGKTALVTGGGVGIGRMCAEALVLAGGVYVPPALMQTGTSGATAPILTPRQIEVLARAIEGKPNKIIAAELDLTEATVKAHVTAVFKALDVTNRTQAPRAAERIGLKIPGTPLTARPVADYVRYAITCAPLPAAPVVTIGLSYTTTTFDRLQ